VEEALTLAAELRADGTRVEVYPEPDKLGKQFKYASARGVSWVAIVGADERVQGRVTVKDMRTGQQTTVDRRDVTSYLRTHPA
jgi:histidyl-tRNA synthetase